MALRGVTSQDVGSLLIAGGFGSYMDVNSALAIGLLPPIPRERIRHVGNSAGAGAALAHAPPRRSEMEAFTPLCTYHELSSSRPFMDNYLSTSLLTNRRRMMNSPKLLRCGGLRI
jgi:uncharacterized 2Fe-2S/4Fe-4S cluster protein (DUF4445 family)